MLQVVNQEPPVSQDQGQDQEGKSYEHNQSSIVAPSLMSANICSTHRAYSPR